MKNSVRIQSPCRRGFSSTVGQCHLWLWLLVLPAAGLSCVSDADTPPKDANHRFPPEQNDDATKSGKGYKERLGAAILALEQLLPCASKGTQGHVDGAEAFQYLSHEQLRAHIGAQQVGDSLLKKLEKHLDGVEKGIELCEERLKKLQQERQQEIAYVSGFKKGLTETVVCKCTRAHCLARSVFFELDERGVFGKGAWYGHSKPAAFLQRYPDTRVWRVPTCIFCRRASAMDYLQNLCERLRQWCQTLITQRNRIEKKEAEMQEEAKRNRS